MLLLLRDVVSRQVHYFGGTILSNCSKLCRAVSFMGNPPKQEALRRRHGDRQECWVTPIYPRRAITIGAEGNHLRVRSETKGADNCTTPADSESEPLTPQSHLVRIDDPRNAVRKARGRVPSAYGS